MYGVNIYKTGISLALVKQFWVLITILVLVIITSCSPAITPTLDQNQSRKVPPASTLLPAAIVHTPSAELGPTHRVTTSQPTQMLKEPILDIPACVSKNLSLSSFKNSPFTGRIIYQTAQNGRTYGLYTIDYAASEEGKLLTDENQEVSVFGVSPDGKWLAYSPITRGIDEKRLLDSPVVILLNSNGKRLVHPFDMQMFSTHLKNGYRWFSFGSSRWINNKFIISTLSGYDPDHTPSRADLFTKIIDPFQGTWEQNLMKNIPEPFMSPEIDFAPDMSRVAYTDIEGLKLWDIRQGTLLAVDEKLAGVTNLTIRWSPDSASVVYTGFGLPDHQTVRRMSRDGMITNIETPDPIASPQILTWSPDGRYFAVKSIDQGKNIYIFDTMKDVFLFKCAIPDDVVSLVWSPNSLMLAYSGLETPLHILNILDGIVIDTQKNANVVGWSDQFPKNIP